MTAETIKEIKRKFIKKNLFYMIGEETEINNFLVHETFVVNETELAYRLDIVDENNKSTSTVLFFEITEEFLRMPIKDIQAMIKQYLRPDVQKILTE